MKHIPHAHLGNHQIMFYHTRKLRHVRPALAEQSSASLLAAGLTMSTRCYLICLWEISSDFGECRALSLELLFAKMIASAYHGDSTICTGGQFKWRINLKVSTLTHNVLDSDESLFSFSRISIPVPRRSLLSSSGNRQLDSRRFFFQEITSLPESSVIGRYLLLFQKPLCDRCQVGLDEVSQITDKSRLI